MKFPVAIEMGNGFHAYRAAVPDLPGCFAAGDSLQATLAQVRHAIVEHCESLASAGEHLPLPRSLDEWREAPSFTGSMWSTVNAPIERLFLPRAA